MSESQTQQKKNKRLSHILYRLSSYTMLASILYIPAWDSGAIQGSVFLSQLVDKVLLVSLPLFAIGMILHAKNAWQDYKNKKATLSLIDAVMATLYATAVCAMPFIFAVIPLETGMYGDLGRLLGTAFVAVGTYATAVMYRSLHLLYLFSRKMPESASSETLMLHRREVIDDMVRLGSQLAMLITCTLPMGWIIISSVVLSSHFLWYVAPKSWQESFLSLFDLGFVGEPMSVGTSTEDLCKTTQALIPLNRHVICKKPLIARESLAKENQKEVAVMCGKSFLQTLRREQETISDMALLKPFDEPMSAVKSPGA